MEKTFFGAHVPIITPFTLDGQVHDEGIRALTSFFVDAGACCLEPTAKYALELLAFSVGNCRKPLHQLSESEKMRVRNTLQDTGVLKG